MLILDNREGKLIDLIKSIAPAIQYTTENLAVGDIIIRFAGKEEIPPYEIIIERKCVSDMVASIKDGRYKEQKERLLHSIKKSCRKIFLIEGNDYNTFSLSLNTLDSIIINTIIRDNIHIYISKDKNDTIQFIENIILQIPKYYEDLQKEIILGEDKVFQNEFNCHTSKKENLTQDICFRNMLCQIPGISNIIANVFVIKYKNMANFIINLKEQSNNKNDIIKILASEKYGKNNRKIGEKIGEKIFNFIFSDDTDTKEIKNNNNFTTKYSFSC